MTRTATSMVVLCFLSIATGCQGGIWGGDGDTAWRLEGDAARDTCTGVACTTDAGSPDLDETDPDDVVEAADSTGCASHAECTGGKRCYRGKCTYDYPDGYYDDGGGGRDDDCDGHRDCTGGKRCYRGECTYDYPDGYFRDGGAADVPECHSHGECTGGKRCYRGECTYDYPDGYYSDGG